MAKARVTVTCPECGTEYTWSVTCYNRREADDWEARHEGEERLCTECWKKARAEERKAARRENWDKAQEETAKAGKTLAPLTGSDKQVEWAEDVRARTSVSEHVDAIVFRGVLLTQCVRNNVYVLQSHAGSCDGH